jgi:hypothetical protein
MARGQERQTIIRRVVDQPGSFAFKPTLTGANVVLRPFNLDQDAGPLHEMLEDPEVLKLTGSYHDPDDEAAWSENRTLAGQAAGLST